MKLKILSKNRIGIISLVMTMAGLSLSAYSVFYQPRKSLGFTVESAVTLLDFDQKEGAFKILMKDSVDISSKSKSLSFFEIEVKNSGSKDIRIVDFDPNLGLGISLRDGQIVSQPEITNSSDSDYYTDVFESISVNKISFRKKIYNTNSFFAFKIFVLHDIDASPYVKSFGRITGQGSVTVTNRSPIKATDKDFESRISRTSKLVLISFFFTVLGFLGLVYAYLKSIKNQKIIAEQKSKIIALKIQLDKKDL